MKIEEIIQSWKACEECEEAASSTNPVGEELSNQELEEVTGGMSCTFSIVCPWTDF